MSGDKILGLYLDAGLRARLATGNHNFFGHVVAAFEGAGWRVNIHGDGPTQRALSRTRRGYAIFHMRPPTTRRSLTARMAYTAPFWRLEATGKRWDFDVARAAFHPESVDPELAEDFRTRTINRLYPWAKTDPNTPQYVYVALQGTLLRRRGFQAAAPIEMLRDALARFADDPVVVGWHPGARYSARERAQVTALVSTHPGARLSHDHAEDLLPGARLIVTQNSSVAFLGAFVDVPAVLYAQSDFHHIAANVRDLGVDGAFAQAARPRDDYARYVYWYLKDHAINAGHDSIRDAILRRASDHGWPV